MPTQAVNPPGKYQGSLSWNCTCRFLPLVRRSCRLTRRLNTDKGCYKSSLKNRQGMPLALQAFYGQTQITQEECLTLAESKGMPVAALRNGNQCLGGFALPSDAIPSAAEECSVAGFGGACLGDPSTDCGGRESMDVYVRQCAPLRTGPSNACLDGYLGFKYDGCQFFLFLIPTIFPLLPFPTDCFPIAQVTLGICMPLTATALSSSFRSSI